MVPYPSKGTVTKLVNDPCRGPSLGKTHLDHGGGSFPIRLAQPIAKRMLRLEQHKLYLMAKKWRTQEPSLQTSQPDLGGDTKNIEGLRKKGGNWKE